MPTDLNDEFIALLESRPGAEGIQAASLEAAIPINDFIYMSTGTSNAYMIVTDAGRIIINTGMGFEAVTHKALFDAICPGPTPYILLTQGHVDHVGGVHRFREPETKLIAQANNAACQLDDERTKQLRQSQSYVWFSHVIDIALEIMQRDPSALIQDIPTPDITFEDEYKFSFGGIDFEIISTPGGETIDSCVIWLPQHKICFSGNVFGALFPHFPNFNTLRGDKYRFADPYLESLERVRALEPEMLITGHFDPIVGKDLVKTCLDRLEAAVKHVYSETLAGMNEGKDVWTLMKEVQLPEELRVGQGYGKVSWGVRTIWESNMGWFHLRSTTELYPEQPSSIYPDLVELAGIDAVVERGHERLWSGALAEALHLGEAAVAADPNSKPALSLLRDAHAQLLERSRGENFWERGWLQTQIKQLDARIAQDGADA